MRVKFKLLLSPLLLKKRLVTLMPYSDVGARAMKWFGLNRSELLPVLEGGMPPAKSMREENAAEIAVGVILEDDRPILTLLVIVDEQLTEFLAWLSTFAPELFPLSQTVRVLSKSDFAGMQEDFLQVRPHQRVTVWPSVIIGEVLAQGEPAQNLQTLPLSRASASFSFCQARASLIYPSNARVRKVTNSRLSQLQRERSFTQRLVNVDDMSAIWSFVDEISGCTPFQREWIRSAVGIVEADSESPYGSAVVLERLGINVRKLADGTIEGRVLEFEKAMFNIFGENVTNSNIQSNIPLIIAALCFLVGRGTSHVSLLDEYANEYPTVYAWFGLMAGLVGPSSWDSQWARIATSVERLLRSGFSIFDPPSADICWAEYDWIASQRQSLPWFTELPKLYPRLVSVEVVPGASCQFRLDYSEDVVRPVRDARQIIHNNVAVEVQKPRPSDEKIASIETILCDALRELRTLRNESVHGITQNDFFSKADVLEPAKAKAPRKRTAKK
jgi:hypothetical protein